MLAAFGKVAKITTFRHGDRPCDALSFDTTFEIDCWAQQVTAEQDALNHLDLLAQTDDELACGVCDEQPAVLADDEVDEGCYSAIQRGTRLGNVSLPNSAHSRFRCRCAPRHSRSAIRS